MEEKKKAASKSLKNRVNKKEEEKRRKEQEEREEKRKKRIIVLILLILLLMLFVTFNVWDIVMGTPTKPIISETNKAGEWSTKKIIGIEEDATSRKKIKYYLYCITDKKDPSNCKWKKTYTKNVEVTKEGINYVYFRAVDEDDKKGKISDPIEVKIDTTAPEIIDVKATTTTTTITVKVEAKDLTSGIDKYYYKIGNNEFVESKKNIYTFDGLEPDTEYEIIIKVVDKAKNEKELILKVRTDKDGNISDIKEQKEESVKEIPELSLAGIPGSFYEGKNYSLPTSYKFGPSGGSVVCTVNGKEATSTKNLNIGMHRIECIATSNTGVQVREGKTIKIISREEIENDEVWDGWITMHLYYPENSTEREWRIGLEGVARDGSNHSEWEAYTGPITVRLSEVNDVYIRYKLNGEWVIIPPNNKPIIDIESSKNSVELNETTKVWINYDKDASVKEYQIDGEEWKEYAGSFYVGADTLITARVKKVVNGETQTSYDYKYISLYTPSSSGPSDWGSSTGGGKNQGRNGSGNSSGGSWNDSGRELSDRLLGPVVSVNPTEVAKEVEVSIDTYEEPKAIYYSINNGSYKKYEEAFIVTKNCTIHTYYIREEDGRTSETTDYRVTNVYEGKKPYVRIDTEPNLNVWSDSVKVTISGSNYDTLEYSYDGKIYFAYEGVLEITENCRVYAKGTNSEGITTEYIDITHIGNIPPEKKKDILSVSIAASPEKSDVVGLINQTEITINYDDKAEKKYYTINGGSAKEYTQPFTVSSNATIKAYAYNSSGYGETEKLIDYLTNGIATPIIKVNPDKEIVSSVEVSINYDQTSSEKLYKINDSDWYTYTGPFTIDEEDTIITAYNENSLGYSALATKTIENIYIPKYTLIDKGDYFILKLNYPSMSMENTREYKWTRDGKWKKYDPYYGVLLIKGAYKEKLITSDGVKIIDDDGKEKLYTDHYYVVNNIQDDLSENLFMRWDTYKPSSAIIKPSNTNPAKKVDITLDYDEATVVRQYKLVYENGEETEWIKYTGSFTINKNNTTIYTKGITDNNVESDIGSYTVRNIDEIDPTISIKADLDTPTNRLYVQLIGEDNLGVESVAWAKGVQSTEYFEKNGNFIRNKGTFTIDENGKYTIYVSDKVGNQVVKVIEVNNIDKTLPNIYINVLPEIYTSQVEVSIDYGNSTEKQYKIGTSGTYKNYTDNLTIKSVDVKNLFNEDGSLTICAKGKNAARNEEEICNKIYNLDYEVPNEPIINANATAYPMITAWGIKLDTNMTIKFDTTYDDIVNYYSTDNGKTWNVYVGPIKDEMASTIMTKSVRESTGLTLTASKTVTVSSDALNGNAYDGDKSTSHWFENTSKRILISDEIRGWKLKLNYRFWTGAFESGTVMFLDEYGSVITQWGVGGSSDKTFDEVCDIPENARYLQFAGGTWNRTTTVYEVGFQPSPTITTISKELPILNSNGVTKAYDNINIDYFMTSVKRLYRIDGGEWKNYEGPFKAYEGEVVEAYGIDSYGVATDIEKYSITLRSDAVGKVGYDGDSTTYHSYSTDIRKIMIADKMREQKVKLHYRLYTAAFESATVMFLDEESKVITQWGIGGSTNRTFNAEYDIPLDAKYLQFSGGSWNRIYEIGPVAVPVINKTPLRPILTESGVVFDKNTKISIYFDDKFEKKLYSLDNITWKDYTAPVDLKVGETIYAKGIDSDGNDSYVPKYTLSITPNILEEDGYDGDIETQVETGSTKRIYVNSNMQGEIAKYYTTGVNTVSFYTSKDKLLNNKTFNEDGWHEFTIPLGTSYITFTGNSVGEVSPKYEPTINYSDYDRFPILKKDGVVEPSTGKVTITYSKITTKKQYSLDNVNWKTYKGAITINVGDTLYARGIDKEGNYSDVVTYTIRKDEKALYEKAYDDNTSTYLDASNGRRINIDSSLVGNNIQIYALTEGNITFYSKDGSILKTLESKVGWQKIEIPSNTSYMIITTDELYEITANVEEINYPLISINNKGNWDYEKEVTITYSEDNLIHEYSINLEDWIEYKDSFVIEEENTIYARELDNNGDIVSSSTYQVTKIDTTVPTITMETLREVYEYKSDHEIKYTSNIDNNKSGGNVVCRANDTIVSNLSTLTEGTYEVKCTVTTGTGRIASSEAQTISIKESKGMINYIASSDFENDSIVTKAFTSDYTLNAHVYNYDGNQVWNSNMIFGDSSDVGTDTTDATRTVVVKVNGNLTIESGVTVGPYYNSYGGPKGFILYVTGDIINNGTIDNSHGAKAVGENVYLYENNDNTSEVVPATGGTGGAASTRTGTRYYTYNGATGTAASGRETGGGGSGGARHGDGSSTLQSGAGGQGTSYSGGTGGGAAGSTSGNAFAESGHPNGGAGGYAVANAGSRSSSWSPHGDGGGAGNPGGAASSYWTGAGSSTAYDGANGTGGLLIIYTNSLINTSTGKICANGSDGGSAAGGYSAGGGASGGGSINVFYRGTYVNNGTVSAEGGTGGAGSATGGAGGAGSITIGSVSTGKFIKTN